MVIVKIIINTADASAQALANLTKRLGVIFSLLLPIQPSLPSVRYIVADNVVHGAGDYGSITASDTR